MEQGSCWIDGRIIPLGEAAVPVTDHGLLYGDGVFEGIRFYNARPFLLKEHLRRLRDSARAIALDLPWEEAELASIVEALIAAHGQPSGYLRLIVTRGSGAMGIDPARCPAPRLIVIATALEIVPAEKRARGIRLVTASVRRLGADGLDPRIKSLNYLNPILARIEATAAGADEALLLNARGRVAEASTENLFIARQGRLLTPPVSEGALDGITRALILQLAEELGIEVAEVPLAPYDLHTADEAFLTGTGAELIPVREIDGRRLAHCPGPLFRRCEAAFRDFIRHQCKEAS